MLGIYFSGTGNTKYCVETFVQQCDRSGQVISIEDIGVVQALEKNENIVLGYPLYFSNIPKILRDFIRQHASCFQGKNVFVIATMGLFSGDGAGCGARLLKKCGCHVVGGLHIIMPDCIGDAKALKKSVADNRTVVMDGREKLVLAAQQMMAGAPPQQGLSILHRIAGLIGQRLWFYPMSVRYQHKPNVAVDRCIGCGLCSKVCPRGNIQIVSGKAKPFHGCTLCYRCFSHCPTQALTILGRTVYQQSLVERYL